MRSVPTVASVLLLATETRRRHVQPWLGVVGEPVGYALEALDPSELPELGRSWDVIVVDGLSCASGAQRARVLRRASQPPHRFASTIYLAGSSEDGERALSWAHDVVAVGAQQGERLRRRVQGIALAPWRRSLTLRLEAERRGPQRLRLVVSNDDPGLAPEPVTQRSARLDRALPFVLLQKAVGLGQGASDLVTRAFHEGRRVGVATMRDKTRCVCAGLSTEIEQGRRLLRDEDVAEMEARYRDEGGSPVVAARFGGASAAVAAAQADLERIAAEELVAVERYDVCPASEP